MLIYIQLKRGNNFNWKSTVNHFLKTKHHWSMNSLCSSAWVAALGWLFKCVSLPFSTVLLGHHGPTLLIILSVHINMESYRLTSFYIPVIQCHYIASCSLGSNLDSGPHLATLLNLLIDVYWNKISVIVLYNLSG